MGSYCLLSLAFKTMKEKTSRKPLIFAHRGANRETAENTRLAFDKALEYPIDGIETDVQLSRDEVPVLWHDQFLGKLGLAGKHIDDFDFARMEKMDFAGYFSPETKPEAVLSLKEFLEKYRGRCRLQIEVKHWDWETPQRHESKMRQCFDLIGSWSDEEIFISSFNLSSLILAHQYSPGFPLYFALNETQTPEDANRFLTEYPFLRGLCVHIEILDDKLMQVVREKDKHILVYTCNSDDEISKALEFDVDVLITDDPQKALQMRSQCDETSHA